MFTDYELTRTLVDDRQRDVARSAHSARRRRTTARRDVTRRWWR